jgi:hypothetical protein
MINRDNRIGNVPETYYKQLARYDLKNGCKVTVWQSGRMGYGMSVKLPSGACYTHSITCGKKDLKKRVEFYLKDYYVSDEIIAKKESESKAHSYIAMVERRKQEIIQLIGVEKGTRYIMLADQLGQSIL